ncbi:hypothetical protein RYX36_010454, partial [Vicia faba]
TGNGNTNYQPEESGWTSYFEDFSKHIEPSYCSSSLGGSSLVSDAASCAAWKFSHKNHVTEMNSREMMSRKIDDQLDVSRGKGFKSERYPKVETNDCDINFNGKNVDCPGLEKKGLCLVPMSMLVNYYG